MAAAPTGTGATPSLTNVQQLDLSSAHHHHHPARSSRERRAPGALDAREALLGQQSCVAWFTGLPGVGKTTIATAAEKRLLAGGRHAYVLDGDDVRHGLNRDLGFAPADRIENVRRLGEVARLMADAGLIVLVAAIAPFRAERDFARTLVPAGRFFEIFVDAPLHVAEQRDPKGLYRRARQGALRDVTGIDSPYETPHAPELRLDTTQLSAEQAAELVIERLREAGVFRPLAAA